MGKGKVSGGGGGQKGCPLPPAALHETNALAGVRKRNGRRERSAHEQIWTSGLRSAGPTAAK